MSIPWMVTFHVDGVPRPQPRQRAVVRGGKPSTFDPGTAKSWRERVTQVALSHRPSEPLEGPVALTLVVFLPRPKRLMRKKDPEGSTWAPTMGRNDWDNLGKVVCDALTDVGIWRDDGQVVDARVVKLYHSKTGTPGASITVRAIETDYEHEQ